MSEELTLREPARSLWLRTRDAIRESLSEIGVDEYRIGGGTVLAARWNGHRTSYDVDLTVSEKAEIYALRNPHSSGFVNRMTRLGGTIHEAPEARLIQVKFGTENEQGGIDIWGHDLQLPGDEGPGEVEGLTETVLSNAQILWGKLARGDDPLPRDVWDVVEAAERDPESLEQAVNALQRGRAERVALTWYEQGSEIAREALTKINGVKLDEETARTLGIRGTRAIKQAYYTDLTIRRNGARIEMETRSVAGATRQRECLRAEGRRLLEKQGLMGNRGTGGPRMQEVAAYAVRHQAGRPRDELLYSEENGRATGWVTARSRVDPGGRSR